MNDSKNGMVSFLYKHLYELVFRMVLIQHHCIICRQNLIDKVVRFKQIMTDVRAVNLIRSDGLNHRQFKEFLEETGSEYGDTVCYCGVQLSKSKVLQCFLSL